MDDLVTRGMVIAMFDERLAGMGTDVGKLFANLMNAQTEIKRISDDADEKANFMKKESDEREQVHVNTVATLDARIAEVQRIAEGLEVEVRRNINDLVIEFRSYIDKVRVEFQNLKYAAAAAAASGDRDWDGSKPKKSNSKLMNPMNI